MLGISDAAESVGMQTMGVSVTFQELVSSSPFPCIAHWQQNHFVVIYKIIKKSRGYIIKVADPAHGLITYRQNEFLKAAEVRSEIARAQYQNGLLSFEDWDLIENDLIDKQKAMLTSQRDAVVARAAWEKMLGTGVIP